MSNGIWVEANTSSGQLFARSLDHARSLQSLLTDAGWQRAQEHFGGSSNSGSSGSGSSGSPDVRVESLSVSPQRPTVGETVTVEARIKNHGSAAGGASWSAYQGSLGTSGSLSPGETTRGSYSFTATRPGSHSISVDGKTQTVVVEEQTTPDDGLANDPRSDSSEPSGPSGSSGSGSDSSDSNDSGGSDSGTDGPLPDAIPSQVGGVDTEIVLAGAAIAGVVLLR